jgi:hypothetical protein
MRWRGGRQSTNVEDYRGRRSVGTGLKLGGGAIVALLLAWFFGVDPRLIMGVMEGVQTNQVEPPPPGGVQQTGGPDDELAQFVAVVLADTEDTWGVLFADRGAEYIPPKLVLFTDAVQSACGRAGASVGPFYCPADQKVYIDLGFYRELRDQFQAPGDFAQAYVIAHEVGHHVQNLLGLMEKIQARQRRASEREANALSVRLELQADCLAGIWANFANRERKILEPGDIQEGLNAAAQIGDDNLQKRAQGYVVPEGFTHGSAAQRVSWFRRGIESGDLKQCDTFSTRTVS